MATVVYAEKQDMGLKLAAALGGFKFGEEHITLKNLSKHQDAISKSSKAKGYIKTSYKGQSYYVTWGWGHFGMLKQASDYNPDYAKWTSIPLPFIPNKYEIKFVETREPNFQKMLETQFEVIKSLFQREDVDSIISATDPEREGELIFSYLYELSGCKKPYFRVLIRKQTEEGITSQFENLLTQAQNKKAVDAARARAIADWVLGINLTVASTLKFKPQGTFNIGRVITPTLNILCEREKEIQNFTSKKYYSIVGEFTAADGSKYEGVTEETYDSIEEAEKEITKIKGEAIVTSLEKKLSSVKPPMPFNTATLYVTANKKYHLTIEDVEKILQFLYEKGYVTYPRTDSNYLFDDAKFELPKIISAVSILYPKIDAYIKSFNPSMTVPDSYFNSEKIEGHAAITITEEVPAKGFLSQDQARVYDLIARRTMALASPNAKLEDVKMETTVGDYIFKSSGRRFIEPGFYSIIGMPETKNVIPSSLSKGNHVFAQYKVRETTTKPPERLTDATLIKAMQNCGRKLEDEEARKILNRIKGIGRPSTYGKVLTRLLDCGFVTRSKNSLVPTQRAMLLMDTFPIVKLKNPELTVKWEMDLDMIASGTKSASEFIYEVENQTKEWIDEIRGTEISAEVSENLSNDSKAPLEQFPCPKCKKPMQKSKYSLYCNNCSIKINETNYGYTLTEKQLASLIIRGRTGFINKLKVKDGETFGAYLYLTEDFKVRSTKESIYKCPVCQSSLMFNGERYFCSNTDCKFSLSLQISNKQLPPKAITKLLTGQETDVIDGFISKDGKKYKAKLKLLSDGKLDFIFSKKK